MEKHAAANPFSIELRGAVRGERFERLDDLVQVSTRG